MLPARLLKRPITIVRASAVTDRYGTTVYSWDNPQRHEVMGELQPKTSSENVIGRTSESTDAVCYLQPGVAVQSDDRLEVDGQVWFVVGPPLTYFRLGVPHHIAANVRRVEG